MDEKYNEPQELSDLIDKESENVNYILRGFIRNPEYISDLHDEKIIGIIEVRSSGKDSKDYFIPFDLENKKLNMERTLNILKFFDRINLELSFDGKYTNKKNGLLSMVFKIEKIELKNYPELSFF